MSRTYTNKPSTSQAAGRGAIPRRTRQNPQPSMAAASRRPGQSTSQRTAGRGSEPSQNLTDRGPGMQGNQQEAQHRDAYHVIPPNEQNRNRNREIAKKEEQGYKKYKESQKLGRVSYVGTVGGSTGPPEARNNSHTNHRQTVTARKAGSSQQWKADQKRLDHAKTEQHKATQRLKAEQNAERDSARHRRLDADRRRTNEDFLARFDKGVQEKKSDKILSSSAARDSTS